MHSSSRISSPISEDSIHQTRNNEAHDPSDNQLVALVATPPHHTEHTLAILGGGKGNTHADDGKARESGQAARRECWNTVLAECALPPF